MDSRHADGSSLPRGYHAIAAEIGGIDATAAFVRAGVGIAILPAYAIAPHADLRAVKVREQSTHRFSPARAHIGPLARPGHRAPEMPQA